MQYKDPWPQPENSKHKESPLLQATSSRATAIFGAAALLINSSNTDAQLLNRATGQLEGASLSPSPNSIYAAEKSFASAAQEQLNTANASFTERNAKAAANDYVTEARRSEAIPIAGGILIEVRMSTPPISYSGVFPEGKVISTGSIGEGKNPVEAVIAGRKLGPFLRAAPAPGDVEISPRYFWATRYEVLPITPDLLEGALLRRKQADLIEPCRIPQSEAEQKELAQIFDPLELRKRFSALEYKASVEAAKNSKGEIDEGKLKHRLAEIRAKSMDFKDSNVKGFESIPASPDPLSAATEESNRISFRASEQQQQIALFDGVVQQIEDQKVRATLHAAALMASFGVRCNELLQLHQLSQAAPAGFLGLSTKSFGVSIGLTTVNLLQALQGSTSEDAQALQDIKAEVLKVREEMHARFDQVDLRLNELLDLCISGFRAIQAKSDDIQIKIHELSQKIDDVQRLAVIQSQRDEALHAQAYRNTEIDMIRAYLKPHETVGAFEDAWGKFATRASGDNSRAQFPAGLLRRSGKPNFDNAAKGFGEPLEFDYNFMHALGAHSPSRTTLPPLRNLNYLLAVLRNELTTPQDKRKLAHLFPAGRPLINIDLWLYGTEGLIRLAELNPKLLKMGNTGGIDAEIRAGREYNDALSALRSPEVIRMLFEHLEVEGQRVSTQLERLERTFVAVNNIGTNVNIWDDRTPPTGGSPYVAPKKIDCYRYESDPHNKLIFVSYAQITAPPKLSELIPEELKIAQHFGLGQVTWRYWGHREHDNYIAYGSTFRMRPRVRLEIGFKPNNSKELLIATSEAQGTGANFKNEGIVYQQALAAVTHQYGDGIVKEFKKGITVNKTNMAVVTNAIGTIKPRLREEYLSLLNVALSTLDPESPAVAKPRESLDPTADDPESPAVAKPFKSLDRTAERLVAVQLVELERPAGAKPRESRTIAPYLERIAEVRSAARRLRGVAETVREVVRQGFPEAHTNAVIWGNLYGINGLPDQRWLERLVEGVSAFRTSQPQGTPQEYLGLAIQKQSLGDETGSPSLAKNLEKLYTKQKTVSIGFIDQQISDLMDIATNRTASTPKFYYWPSPWSGSAPKNP